MHGIAHPSQPNDIALFSGSLNGVTDDNQHDLTAPNLATRLAGKGLTFASYSEGLPSPGFRGWASGRYVRRHNAAPSFTNVPDSDILPFSRFPSDDAKLPMVAMVIPNLDNDMHDGTVAAGDAWLRENLVVGADAQQPLHRDVRRVRARQPGCHHAHRDRARGRRRAGGKLRRHGGPVLAPATGPGNLRAGEPRRGRARSVAFGNLEIAAQG